MHIETIDNYVSFEKLEELLAEDGYLCFGHGTGRNANSEEIINSIFEKGLRTKDNSLYYTTICLSTPTKQLIAQYKELGLPEPNIESLKQQLNNWPHQESKKIIIARLPIKFINQTGDRSDLDGEMFGAFYNSEIDLNGKETYYLDSKFIIGCFDVERQEFLLNNKFEKTLNPQTIEKLQTNYQKTIEKTNKRLTSDNLTFSI